MPRLGSTYPYIYNVLASFFPQVFMDSLLPVDCLSLALHLLQFRQSAILPEPFLVLISVLKQTYSEQIIYTLSSLFRL